MTSYVAQTLKIGLTSNSLKMFVSMISYLYLSYLINLAMFYDQLRTQNWPSSDPRNFGDYDGIVFTWVFCRIVTQDSFVENSTGTLGYSTPFWDFIPTNRVKESVIFLVQVPLGVFSWTMFSFFEPLGFQFFNNNYTFIKPFHKQILNISRPLKYMDFFFILYRIVLRFLKFAPNFLQICPVEKITDSQKAINILFHKQPRCWKNLSTSSNFWCLLKNNYICF